MLLGDGMDVSWNIVRVEVNGRARWGAVQEGVVLELPEGPFGESPAVGERLGYYEEMSLLPPAAPTKIICVGRNYVAHAAEHGADVPREPALFLKPPSSLLAAGGVVVRPPQSSRVEHEGELAIVIGRRCRRLPPGQAWANVLGVTCANDVTARDLQRADVQWTRGKGFDTFCPVGPWLVTGLAEDEVGELELSCRVNGQLRQHARLDEMVFSPATVISYASQVMTLEPGDLLLTGTPSGVGPLEAGDVVEVEIDRIGVLSNPVADQE